MMVLLLLWLPLSSVVADELPASEAIDTDGYDAEDIDADEDDTADYDVETTVDITDAKEGVLIDGDARPIVDYFNVDGRDGASLSDERLDARVRLGENVGINYAQTGAG